MCVYVSGNVCVSLPMLIFFFFALFLSQQQEQKADPVRELKEMKADPVRELKEMKASRRKARPPHRCATVLKWCIVV